MEIHSYKPEYAPTFDRLNRAWIEQYFVVEPFDNEVLTKPDQHILNKGGELWFAVENGEAIGACALIKLEEGMYEFTKLGVDEKARGKGVARTLLCHCRDRAKALGAHTLRIYTSRQLIPANKLYVSEGFTEVAMSDAQRQRYKRADIMYDYPLL